MNKPLDKCPFPGDQYRTLEGERLRIRQINYESARRGVTLVYEDEREHLFEVALIYWFKLAKDYTVLRESKYRVIPCNTLELFSKFYKDAGSIIHNAARRLPIKVRETYIPHIDLFRNMGKIVEAVAKGGYLDDLTD